MSSQTLILAGWDYEDLTFCQSTFKHISKNCRILSYPYTSFAKITNLEKLGIEEELSSIAIDELMAIKTLECNQNISISSLDACDYEHVLLQLERTIHNQLPFYKKLRLIRSCISIQKAVLTRGNSANALLIFRDWPHLFSDYTLYLSAQLLGYNSFVLQPLKGFSRGFREEWNPFDSAFYIVHNIKDRQVIPMEVLPSAINDLTKKVFYDFICLETIDSKYTPSFRRSLSLIPKSSTRASFELMPNHKWLKKNAHIDLRGQASLNKLHRMRLEYNNVATTLQDISEWITRNELGFIFFPLPKQPEANINPYLKNDYDPSLWISSLLKVLPNNIVVLCKEHPDTFRFSIEHCGHFLSDSSFPRYSGWYSDSLSCFGHRLKYIETRETFSNILNSDQCLGVFTLNGSCLYDCLRIGLPIILPPQHWAVFLNNTYSLSPNSQTLKPEFTSLLTSSFEPSASISEQKFEFLFERIIRRFDPSDPNHDTLLIDLAYLLDLV